ncbi:MAG: type II CRISPR RNA-guided endonuclease Cas9 [Polaribacter sp.]|uniref:type II CRISPR RNA-guided endonuclease Cas9 n=1 Tax=Wenyingzhuangia sp. TaxID=1964193 RepID=UPI00321908CE
MSTKLGLFVDNNSINWSLVEVSTNKLIDLGVHVFPAGCENFGMGKREVSKRYSRRLVRLRRIRYSRIRTRKYYLLKILLQHKMCPLSREDLYHWKRTKQFPKAALAEWMALDPYELRERGLHEKLTLQEFGRIFYQISCHRGYRFGERNSKLADNVLSQGIPADRKIGYLKTRRSIKSNTLGTYLNSIKPVEGETYTKSAERIRNRICTLEMYFDEIHALWDVQAEFYHTLTNELREELIGSPDDIDPKGALFFQRSLKSQKHKVGNCLYEPKKTRCCISSITYQELEAWKWVNTIKFNNRSLEIEDAKKVVDYYNTHYRFNFSEIKKLLGQDYSKNFNYRDEENFRGSFLNSELSKNKYFGNEWFSMDAKNKEDVFHALYFFDSVSRLETYAKEKFGFEQRIAKQFANISIDKNYAPLSRKASNNILYFLRKGYEYKASIYLAGLRNAIKEDWCKLSFVEEEELIQVTLNLYRDTSSAKLIPELRRLLKELFQFTSFNPNRLYGFSNAGMLEQKRGKLAVDKAADNQILALKNSILIQSVFETRKVVNQIIEDYGPIEQINCELSVDVKVNRMQRFMHKLDQKRIMANNKRYVLHLKKESIDLTPMNILKYELWEECKRTCPYSGKEISLELLYTPHVKIVYIHPWSRSLNDSRMNKTLCITEIADQLNNRTPYEYFESQDIYAWEAVKTRCASLFSSTHYHPSSYKKFKRFVKKYNYRDVVKKQFNDPHQLSRSVAVILSQVTEAVQMIPGNVTQHLLDEWLLKSVFSQKNNSNDYRFNVLKAYANTVATSVHMDHLIERNKYERMIKKVKFPVPHENYLTELEERVNTLLVSHKQAKKIISTRSFWRKSDSGKIKVRAISIRGVLHKDSLFGKRKPPNKPEAMHIRRPLRQIKTISQAEKIVDPVIADLIRKRVNKRWNGQGVFPTDIFFDNFEGKEPKPKIFLPNKKGEKVPVFSVRMRETINMPVQLKETTNCYVVPRNNHHITIFMTSDGAYKEEVVTFWTAVNRFRKKEPIYMQCKKNQGKVITHLHINDFFLLGLSSDIDIKSLSDEILFRHLYRVQKLSSKYYEFRSAHKQISSHFDFPDYIRINNFGERKTGWKTYNPMKIKLSVTGKIIFN